jgi:hypothetical protein
MVEPFLRVAVNPRAGVTQKSSRLPVVRLNQAAQGNRGTAAMFQRTMRQNNVTPVSDGAGAPAGS